MASEHVLSMPGVVVTGKSEKKVRAMGATQAYDHELHLG